MHAWISNCLHNIPIKHHTDQIPYRIVFFITYHGRYSKLSYHTSYLVRYQQIGYITSKHAINTWCHIYLYHIKHIVYIITSSYDITYGNVRVTCPTYLIQYLINITPKKSCSHISHDTIQHSHISHGIPGILMWYHHIITRIIWYTSRPYDTPGIIQNHT